jgi:hypothetical protein
MALTDELEMLGKLKQAGTLSEEEFQQAKRILLQDRPSTDSSSNKPARDSIGMAANRYVTFHILMAKVGAVISIILLLIFLSIFASQRRPTYRSMPPHIEDMIRHSK